MLNILYGLSHHVSYALNIDKRQLNVHEILTVTLLNIVKRYRDAIMIQYYIG